MKKLLLIILIFCIKQNIAQESNFKYWHQNSVLVWTDFWGETDTYSTHHASVNCNIGYYFDIINDSIVFRVDAFLNKQYSWKIDNTKNDALLVHEQGHFNICELYARKLRVWSEISPRI